MQLFERTTRSTHLTWARQVFILETAVDRSFPAETPADHWRFQIVWRSPFWCRRYAPARRFNAGARARGCCVLRRVSPPDGPSRG
ncbi:MAG TPA: hypothetical protein DHV85_13665 [Candidatus Accumulibacter sp.]|nr:hypothetical protein [Accumulibacter sp.]